MHRTTGAALMAVMAMGSGTASAGEPRFSGSCDAPLGVRNAPAIGMVPRPTTHVATGAGACSGRIGARPVTREPVTVRLVVEDALGGCASGRGTAVGEARFDRLGLRMPVRMESRVFGPPVTGHGEPHGAGLATFTMLTRVDHDPAKLGECLAGTVREWKAGWHLRTTFAAFSLHPVPAPAPAPPAS